MPASVTSRTRVAPYSRASEPTCEIAPAPKTIRVRAVKSNGALDPRKCEPGGRWDWSALIGSIMTVREDALFNSEFHLALDGAAFVEEFEHVSFVRLVPGNFHGRNRPNV